MFSSDPRTEAFFRSLAEAFAKNRQTSASFFVVVGGLLVVLIVLQVRGALRRARASSRDAEALAAQRGLSGGDLTLAMALARSARVAPLELLTQHKVFEAVTSRALGGQLSAGVAGAPLASGLRRIREALGFDRLPAHAPLLSTRQLPAGTQLDVGAARGDVSLVDELTFTVSLRQPLSCTVGQPLTLQLAHAREARYQLRCRVLATQPGDSGPQITFEHDNAPQRLQQREYARVNVEAPISLHPVSWPGQALTKRDLVGTLRDLSGGGARLSSPMALPPGVIVEASFSVAGQDFALSAVTLSSRGAEVRLEFVDVLPKDRDRLIAAVNRLQTGVSR